LAKPRRGWRWEIGRPFWLLRSAIQTVIESHCARQMLCFRKLGIDYRSRIKTRVALPRA
jgi:hypothetical protein